MINLIKKESNILDMYLNGIEIDLTDYDIYMDIYKENVIELTAIYTLRNGEVYIKGIVCNNPIIGEIFQNTEKYSQLMKEIEFNILDCVAHDNTISILGQSN